MYKSRFHLWLIILGVFLFVKAITNLNISDLIVENTDIKVNVEADTSVKSAIVSAKINGFKLVQTTDNPSLIIRENSKESLDGYDKISNAIYSPIVAYIPLDFTANPEFYYSLGDSAKFINFKGLADAILKDKSLLDLGFTTEKKYKDAKIVLNLPSKGTSYYDKVVEQIYVSLNDNKIPTEAERKELEATVNKLLDKAVVCNDVNKKIDESEFNVYNLFIAPEYYLKDTSYYGTRIGYSNYQPIYFEKTIALSYDMYIKSGEMLGSETLNDLITNRMLKDERFCKTSLYRTFASLNYDGLFVSYNANSLDIIN